VIVIAPPELVPPPAGRLYLTSTTTVEPADPDAVLIENLPKPCWALPRWTFLARPDELGPYIAALRPADLLALVEAIIERTYDGGLDAPE
jgi:hypothetical protein